MICSVLFGVHCAIQPTFDRGYLFGVHCAVQPTFDRGYLWTPVIIYYLAFNPVHARNEATAWLSASTNSTKTMKVH